LSQILEMFQYKSGYGHGESIAAHARRRYRLIPSKGPGAGPHAVLPDPSLWITHYYQSDPVDRVPSNLIPTPDERTRQTRMYLQTQGQILQKEFMLHDRTNWPQIQFPRGPVRNQQYPTPTPPGMAYPPRGPGTGSLAPPAKRARTQANPQHPPATGAAVPVEVDDEEDTSRGDLFDHMTPREVSTTRYKQNHEWMEEIMSSPYTIGQIIPVDLGLGLRGELGGLTDGIFKTAIAPTDFSTDGYVGRLDAGKADEFRKRAAEHIANTNAEMEKMKAKHAKKLAKFKKGILIVEAEKSLRTATHDPHDVGPEYWRLEGRVDDSEDGDESNAVAKVPEKVDDIVAQVEASLGRHTAVVQELRRIQDGGLEERVPSPIPSLHESRNGSQNSGVLIGDTDIDMGSAAGLLDQYHTGFSSNSTPGNSFPTPQPHLQAQSSNGGGTPAHIPSPQPTTQTEGTAAPVSADTVPVSTSTEDVEMGGTPVEGQGTGDWVVVPEGGVSPPPAPVLEPAAIATTISSPKEAASTVTPSAATAAPVSVQENETIADADLDLGLDANDFGSLEDLDTAGDALASYGGADTDDHGGDLDLGEDLDMGMDDSAFGDAFHGVEARDDGDDEGHGDVI
jgi:hypothetical protein